MRIRQLRQCLKDLDFEPAQKWPHALPAMAWKDYLLTGFERTQGEAVELDAEDLNEALKSCYDTLSVPELSRLLHRIQVSAHYNQQDGVLKTYLGDANDKLKKILLTVAETPKEFQVWLQNKSLSLRELSILALLPDIHIFDPILRSLSRIQASKSQGRQIIEFSCECYMAGWSPIENLPPRQSANADQWLEDLKRIRFPNTTAQDQKRSLKLLNNRRSEMFHSRWVRDGDRAGLEIRLRSYSKKQLQVQISQLHKLESEFEPSSKEAQS